MATLGKLTLFLAFVFGLHILVIEARCRSDDSILKIVGLISGARPSYHGRGPPTLFAKRAEAGFRLITPEDQDEWQALRAAGSTNLPPDCEAIELDFTRRNSGLWAATQTTTWHVLCNVRSPSSPFAAWIDRDQLRVAAADYAAVKVRPIARYAESAALLRAGEGVTYRIRWDGYLHNTLSLLLAGATIWSARRWWKESSLLARHRARPDLCPACRYDLTGLPARTCPECGMTSPGVSDRSPAGA